MTAAQFTVDRFYTKDLYVNGAQITHPDLAALLTDHPSNNVGIGTNDPKVKLDINGTNALRLPAGNKTSDRPSVADSDYCIRYNTDDNIFEGYSNGNWGSLGGVTSINQKVTITADNTDGLQFYTDDAGTKTERMTILNDGNVGIGESSPGAKLQVNGNIKIKQTSVINNNSTSYDSGIVFENPSGPHNYYMGYAQHGWFTIGQYHDATPVAYNEFFRANGSDVLLCPDGEGNVGIGTDLPKTKLHISNGHINIEGDANTGNSPKGVFFKNGGVARTFYISGESGGANTNNRHLYLGYSDTLPENFSDSTFTDGAKMVIRGDGNVGIGTTSPTSKLHIKGGDLKIENSGSNSLDSKIIFAETGYDDRFFIATDNAGSGSSAHLVFGVTGSGDGGITTSNVVMDIDGAGNVGIGTDSPGAKLDISGGHLLISDLSKTSAVIELSNVDENKADCIMGISVVPTTEENLTFLVSNGTFTQSPGSITKSGGSNSWDDNAASSIQQVTYQDRDVYDYVDFSWKRNSTGNSDYAIGGLLINGWSFDNNASQYRHLRYIAYGSKSNINRYYYQIEGNSSADTGTVVSNDTDVNTVITLRIHFAHSPLNTYNEDRVQILINGVLSYTFEGSVVSAAGGGTMQALSESDYPVRFGINIWDNGNGLNSIKMKKVSIQSSLLTYNSRSINSLSNSYNFNIKSIPETTNRGSDALENIVSQITGGDSALYIDSNKNVGIGTDSPTKKLHIQGGDILIRGNDAAHKLLFQYWDNNSYFGSHSNGVIGAIDFQGNEAMTGDTGTVQGLGPHLNFRTYASIKAHKGTSNGTFGAGLRFYTHENTEAVYNLQERMCILPDGNVGIGTDSPTDLLTVGNSSSSNTGGTTSMSILAPGQNADAILYFGTQFNSDENAAKKAAIIAEGQDDWSTSKLHFCLNNYATSNGNSNAYTTSLNDSMMTIQPDGNVGIGTTSPGEKLDVNGTVKATSFITSHINITSYKINQATGILSLQDSNDRDLVLCKNSTGKVGIGTDSPSAKLQIDYSLANNTNTEVDLFLIRNTSSTDDRSVRIYATGDSNNNTYLSMEDYYNNSTSTTLRIGTGDSYFNGGNVGIGVSSPIVPLHVYNSHATWSSFPTQADGGTFDTDGTYIAEPAHGNGGHWVSHAETEGSYNHGIYLQDYNLSNTADPENDINQANKISIYCEGGIIVGGRIYLESDERVKNRIRVIDDNIGLDVIRKIECYSYFYNNSTTRDVNISYGFLAQQVKQHIPNAVKFKKDFLPEAMCFAENIVWEDLSDNTYKLTIPIIHKDNSDNIINYTPGTKFKFFLTDNSSNIFFNQNNMIISTLMDDQKSFIFEKKAEFVFIYGYEVDDFHVLDKEKIFTIHHSAIQEIDKIQQEEKAKLEAAETKLTAAETKLAAAETEITTLKDKVTSLETTIADLVARLTALETA